MGTHSQTSKMLQLLPLAGLMAALSQGIPMQSPECCDSKDVGGVSYSLVGQMDTTAYQCLNNCIYVKDQDPTVKFCFASGDLQVECTEDEFQGSDKPPMGGSDKPPVGGSEEPPMEGTDKPPMEGTEAPAAAADDEVVTRVKGYIDAGTCGSVSANSNCGDSATSYYKEITYNSKRVIISSQVPDHTAEHDAITSNPNTRCERYQYVQLPLTPTKASSTAATSLGTVGLAVTGGAFFNHLSNPDGSLAMPNEGASLDSCFGHSAPGGSYHYHANINCTSAGAATGANDPEKCVQIGYMADGYPVYGFCKDTAGKQMTSCYALNSGVTTVSVTTAAGTVSGIGSSSSDYTYDTAAFTAGTCNLDKASGAIHPTTNTYSYFMTTEYPWTPVELYGSEGAQSFCSGA